ncbi:MAG: hypothetical protein GY811_18500 [Myxococcales bacterium]|nr:hypothetical protein [Myxococcales bacterium]
MRNLDYPEFQRAPDRRHYFSAWKAVHLLNNSSADYHKRFRILLSKLASGTGQAEAWQASFGDIPASKLERQYKDYQSRAELQLFQAPYKLRTDVGTHAIRKLSVGERHAVWIRLLIVKANGSGDGKAAILRDIESQIGIAQSQDPAWAGADFWRAAVVHSFPDDAPREHDAEGLLRVYLGNVPTSANAKLGLVATQLEAIVPEERTGLGEPPAGLEVMEGDVLDLVRVASSPRELETIGRYFTLRQQPMTALNFLQRAKKLDAGCASCLDSLAPTIFQLGCIEEAATLEQRAINVITESGDVTSAMRERLEYFRIARTSKEPVAPPTVSCRDIVSPQDSQNDKR